MFTQDGIDTQFTSYGLGQIDCSKDLEHPSHTVLVWLGNSQSLHELPNYKSIHQVGNYEKEDGVSIYIKKLVNLKLRLDLRINSSDVESLSKRKSKTKTLWLMFCTSHQRNGQNPLKSF